MQLMAITVNEMIRRINPGVIGLIPLNIAMVVNTILRRDNRALIQFSFIHAISLATITPLIHEVGHATMAILLFQNSQVQISFLGWLKGARTSYAVSYGLTSLGHFLGKEHAILLTAAGGLMASTIWACIISRWNRDLAISQLFNEGCYAWQGLYSSNLSHDYVRLWVDGGIHPLLPVIGMMGLIFKQISEHGTSNFI